MITDQQGGMQEATVPRACLHTFSSQRRLDSRLGVKWGVGSQSTATSHALEACHRLCDKLMWTCEVLDSVRQAMQVCPGHPMNVAFGAKPLANHRNARAP